MPAAKPITKINRMRAMANEATLPSPDRAFVIRFRTRVRRDGLFDRSVAERPLDISDTAEVRLGFIRPPSICRLTYVTKASWYDCQRARSSLSHQRSHGAG